MPRSQVLSCDLGVGSGVVKGAVACCVDDRGLNKKHLQSVCHSGPQHSTCTTCEPGSVRHRSEVSSRDRIWSGGPGPGAGDPRVVHGVRGRYPHPAIAAACCSRPVVAQRFSSRTPHSALAEIQQQALPSSANASPLPCENLSTCSTQHGRQDCTRWGVLVRRSAALDLRAWKCASAQKTNCPA